MTPPKVIRDLGSSSLLFCHLCLFPCGPELLPKFLPSPLESRQQGGKEKKYMLLPFKETFWKSQTLPLLGIPRCQEGCRPPTPTLCSGALGLPPAVTFLENLRLPSPKPAPFWAPSPGRVQGPPIHRAIILPGWRWVP